MVGRTPWKTVLPHLCVVVVGVSLSVAALALCLPACGAGHGTYVPMILHLAPPFVLSRFEADQNLGAPLVLGLAASLYAGYGLVLAEFRRRHRPALGITLVLTFHYVAAIVTFALGDGDTPATAASLLLRLDVLYFLAMVLYWVGLHVLAFQFAFSPTPYRPRWTRRVTATLLMGLVLGIAARMVCYSIYAS